MTSFRTDFPPTGLLRREPRAPPPPPVHPHHRSHAGHRDRLRRDVRDRPHLDRPRIRHRRIQPGRPHRVVRRTAAAGRQGGGGEKYGTESPIDDPARERQILDDVAARAAGLGLDPDSVTAVFRDQIEANKLVQRGLYARWDAHPDERPTERPDLAKEVRPALDLITTRLLAALQETAPVRADASCEPRLYAAATLSAYGHRLDVLHLRGLGRALPSVCSTD
ncbi:gamma subclass chorismate mutase AroQ [Streptomyces sp. GLT-R25]